MFIVEAYIMMPICQMVRHLSLEQVCVGSNPAWAAKGELFILGGSLLR